MERKSECIFLLVAIVVGFAPVAEAADFKVVVHASNPISSATAKEVSGFFLKKNLTWPDGQEVTAVDLGPDSPIRMEFSAAIHGKKVSSVKSYWQRQIFQGKTVPPMEESTETEVVLFVGSNPGAIGYVSSSFSLGTHVKELAVKD